MVGAPDSERFDRGLAGSDAADTAGEPGGATAERKLIFDINDFDEVSLAPWEWDVKRLAASFVIAGGSNGFDPVDGKEAAWLAAQAYRQRMAEYSLMPVLEIWNDSFDLEAIIENNPDKNMKRFYSKKLASATEQSAHEKEFAKLTFSSGGTPRIIDQPPLIFHFNDDRDKEFFQVAVNTLKEYRRNLPLGVSLLVDRFTVMDVAYKVVGVGSVGTRCGIILLISGKGDPLVLQFKEARQSVLEPYCGAGPWDHAGKRVVMGQRAVQAAGDLFLGWAPSTGKYATFPVNANEAEAPRFARFWDHGHTPGPMAVRSEPPNRNSPCTLDLRYARRE